jgi:hypothetical protein
MISYYSISRATPINLPTPVGSLFSTLLKSIEDTDPPRGQYDRPRCRRATGQDADGLSSVQCHLPPPPGGEDLRNPGAVMWPMGAVGAKGSAGGREACAAPPGNPQDHLRHWRPLDPSSSPSATTQNCAATRAFSLGCSESAAVALLAACSFRYALKADANPKHRHCRDGPSAAIRTARKTATFLGVRSP